MRDGQLQRYGCLTVTGFYTNAPDREIVQNSRKMALFQLRPKEADSLIPFFFFRTGLYQVAKGDAKRAGRCVA